MTARISILAKAAVAAVVIAASVYYGGRFVWGEAAGLNQSFDTLPGARTSEAYSATLGNDGQQLVLQNGWLPPGMRIESNDTLTGAPEVPGDFYFTVRAKDSAPNRGKLFKLTVEAQSLAITTSNPVLPWGQLGVRYDVKFAINGGKKSYSWKLLGEAPHGLTLRNDGTLSGTPSEAGDFSFKVQVSDSQQSVARGFSLHISPLQVDRFSGIMALRSAKGATGKWRTEKIGQHWLIVTPEGHGFYMFGIWGITGDPHKDERGGTYDDRVKAKYQNWATVWLQANKRFRSWGFNTLGPWSYRMVLPWDAEPEWGGTQPVKLPFIVKTADASFVGRDQGVFKSLYGGLDSNVKRRVGLPNFPDVFDPAWLSNMRKLFTTDQGLRSSAQSPYFVGAFSDDTDYLRGFGPGPDFATDPPGKTHPHLGYIALVTAPSQSTNPYSSPPGLPYADTKVYTKYALRDFLQAKYHTIAALNAAWSSSYTTFDSDGGWGSGNGLLDENGRASHQWLGNAEPTLPPDGGASANLIKDLDDFLYQITRQLLLNEREALKSVAPNALFFGPTNLGGWFAPTRAPVYRAAGELLDVISVVTDCSQEQLDFISRTVGDHPLSIWEGMLADPDSGRWRFRNPEKASWRTESQAARGRLYERRMNLLADGVSSVTGSKPYVGIMWWWWLDMISEKANWGLVSVMDNAYDGVEATMAKGVDAWGYPTGGEEHNYGDFIGPARATNYSVLEKLANGK